MEILCAEHIFQTRKGEYKRSTPTKTDFLQKTLCTTMRIVGKRCNLMFNDHNI